MTADILFIAALLGSAFMALVAWCDCFAPTDRVPDDVRHDVRVAGIFVHGGLAFVMMVVGWHLAAMIWAAAALMNLIALEREA
jgi:hypothetical protein